VEPPKFYGPKSGKDLVLKLPKSLYGLKQAPRTFFEKLKTGLLEHEFEQSDCDPCLLMKNGIIFVVYVDDTIFSGADGEELEKEIAILGVQSNKVSHSFQLQNEGKVGNFLGIRFEKRVPMSFISHSPVLQKN